MDKFVQHRLNGSMLLSVIQSSDSPQSVARDLDDLMLDTLGMTDIIERKRVLHLILVLYWGLDAESHFPPLSRHSEGRKAIQSSRKKSRF